MGVTVQKNKNTSPSFNFFGLDLVASLKKIKFNILKVFRFLWNSSDIFQLHLCNIKFVIYRQLMEQKECSGIRVHSYSMVELEIEFRGAK